MRNPLSLCAVALALASSASAFEPSDYAIVVPQSDVAQAVKETCPDPGKLVAPKAHLKDGCWGYNCHIDLFCVSATADGKMTISDPIKKDKLELTVYGGWFTGGEYQYELNRNPKGHSIVVRDPIGDELTKPSLPAPTTAPSTKPKPGQTTKPKPGQTTKPKPDQTTKPKPDQTAKPKPGKDAALTDAELRWLSFVQRNNFSVDTEKKPAPADSELAKIRLKYREMIVKNVRPGDGATKYKALIDAQDFDPTKINLALDPVKPWGVPPFPITEVSLTKEEFAGLATVLKKDHPELTLSNAQQDFVFKMQKISIDPKAVPPVAKASEFVSAYETVKKFRPMAPTAKPGEGPNGEPIQLADTYFDKVPDVPPGQRQKLKDAYAKDWAGAKTDDDKRKVNAAYLKQIDELASAPPVDPNAPSKGAPDLKKLTEAERAAYDKDMAEAKKKDAATKGQTTEQDKVNLAYRKKLAIRDKATFGSLSGPEKADVCAPYKKAILSADAAAASSDCTVEKKSQRTVACKTDAACLAKIDKECSEGGVGTNNSAPSSSAPPEITDPDVKKQCFDINAGATSPPDKGTKGDLKAGPPSPCGKDANPTAKSGKDEECGKKEPKGDDKQFYANVANGTAFGIAGLILGSFFGGPLIMAAVAIAAGVGAYYLSKSITEPPDKKK